MNNLLALSRRRWLTEYKSHLASTVIASAVVLAWLLYWGYMEFMGASMSSRVAKSDFPADVAISLPAGTYYSINSSYAKMLQSYQAFEVETPLGMQPVAAVVTSGNNAPLPDPAPGEVWLPDDLRGLNQIDVGSPFQISYLQNQYYHVLEGRVAGFYPGYDYYPAIVVASSWLSDRGVLEGAEEVSFYSWTGSSGRWPGHLPDGAKVLTAESTAEQARRVVEVAFSSGGEGVGLLFLFMILGVGTFSLLSYMDSRRELALCKSMGLRPKEVSGLFVFEGAFTFLLAFGIALAIATAMERWTALPVSLTGMQIARAALLSLVAFAAATAVPYVLTQRASVNELLLGRPVPLFRSSTDGLNRHYPALEPLLAAGFRLLKLRTVDDKFDGICFRHVGQRVKVGETLAWEGSTWGLVEREYLAPCNGEIVQANLDQGLLVIRPDQYSGTDS